MSDGILLVVYVILIQIVVFCLHHVKNLEFFMYL